MVSIELLRAEGARFLVFPRSALWWLNHYLNFKQYLDETGRAA
jgi:hypothetical protein